MKKYLLPAIGIITAIIASTVLYNDMQAASRYTESDDVQLVPNLGRIFREWSAD